MGEPPHPGPLCTRTSLASDLRGLGIATGSILLVHSSLSALGWVCGGAEAVVQALLDVLGPQGTLVTPGHSGENSNPEIWQHPPVPKEWWPTIRAEMPAFDLRTTRTRAVGVIPETLRTWPGAVRSAHPQTSFVALGAEANEIVEGHALDSMLGERSPLARLEDRKAKILLLGAGWGSCTAFHLAEYRGPGEVARQDNSFAIMVDGKREWKTVRDVPINEEGFKELGESFERERGDEVVRGKIGAADARLFSLADAVHFAETWLPVHRPYKPDS